MPISSTRRAEGENPLCAMFSGFPTPYWAAQRAILYLGDVRERLRAMPARSVHCCVTSPPYWGLRDYATGTWEGGSAECDHQKPQVNAPKDNTSTLRGRATNQNHEREPWPRGICGKCGAHRTDSQLGLEDVPDCLGWATGNRCGECYICHLVEWAREVKRVLRDDGTFWLNLGDSYVCSAKGAVGSDSYGERPWESKGAYGKSNCGIPDGNLVGIPERACLALQADGWIWRSRLPWVKRSGMPENVPNRPSKSLEDVLLFVKSENYYFDMDAIRPRATTPAGSGGACFGRVSDQDGSNASGAQQRRYDRPNYSDRSFRNNDLWFASLKEPWGAVGVDNELVGLDVTPNTKRGHSDKKKLHFAVFPPRLIEPLILASTSEFGACAMCGAPYKRVSHNKVIGRRKAERGIYAQNPKATGTDHQNIGKNSLRDGVRKLSRTTVGWQKTCGCRTDEVTPCIVLDPFVGSGTTVATSLYLGRAGIGIDLSEQYLIDNVIPRIERALGMRVERKSTNMVPKVVPPPFEPLD